MLEILSLVFLGLCFGSFINALVWRIHKNSAEEKDNATLPIVNGRSICSNCGHQLSWKDLIPVLSYIGLGGKCRYCKQKIEDSPIVELATAALFVLSFIFWPNSFETIQIILFNLWLIFLTGMIAMAVYDIKWFILPNAIIYPLLALAIFQAVALIFVDGFGLSSAKEAIFGAIVGGGLFYLLFQLSKGKWIGGGDVKLGALIGLLIGGPLASFLMLFIASLIGSVVSWPLLISGRAKRNTKLPFGPFLILAAVIVRLFGATIIDWYKRQII